MKIRFAVLGFSIFFIFIFVTNTLAQVEKVDISVDGLACPFCAYGLEKKLKDVEGVGKLEINVDEGVAAAESEPGKSIDVDEIEPAVKDAGFTPKGITLTAVGKIMRNDGTPFLLISETGQKFIIKHNDQFNKLSLLVKDGEKPVRISGSIEHETPENHHAHPYPLAIDKFELIK